MFKTSMIAALLLTAGAALASTEVDPFGGGGGGVSSVSGTPPVAVADGTGDAVVSMPAATSTVNGYLGSADWVTFNAKQSAGSYVLQSTAVNTTAPLAGGGDLSTSRTLSIPAATSSVNGYLTSGDWSTFNGKQPAGSYALQSTAINTTGPLTGGGDLSSTRTLGISQSSAGANGYLSSTDWATFNAKQQAIVPVQQKVWVTANGDDGTGALGDISRPFATLGAAEAVITDAADIKHYEIVVGPGTFDLLGVVWKSYVYFHGAGIDTTQLKTSDNSTWDMTNAGMSTGVNTLGLDDLQVVTPVVADLYSIGGGGHTRYSFENVVFSAGVTMSGRGGEDNVMNYTVRYDGGFDITSMSINGTGIATSAATALRANHGLGAQWIAAGAIVLATMTVQDMDNSSFCLFGGNGIIIGGSGLVVDGASAAAYIDSGALVGGGLTQTNGGAVVLNSVARYVAYTPATSSNWNTVPGQVASALDLIAAGELRPPSWTVAGPINAATSTTDAATAAGVFTAASHVTADGDITVLGMNAAATTVIDSGATDGKALAGGVYTVTRGDHTDTGTQHEMEGTQVLLFHQPDTAGITDKAKGYALTSFAFGGTITNLYDFYSEFIPAGGSVTNHYGLYLSGASGTSGNWGVYSAESTATNWMHGPLKIGSGDTLSDPSLGLEVVGGVKLGQAGLFLWDSGANSVRLVAPAAVTGSYDIILPAQVCGLGESMVSDGTGNLICSGPFASTSFVTSGIASAIDNIPSKPYAQFVCTTNQDIASGGETTCDTQTSFISEILLVGQTDNTENGIYATGQVPWVRTGNMPDNANSAIGAVVAVQPAVGSAYGGTLWYSLADGSGAVPFVQIPTTGSVNSPAKKQGACTVASTTISTTPSNVTCAGVPASAAVAVSCSGASAFSTPGGDTLYARATGTANQLALNTVVANLTAMTFACSWAQP